MPCVTARPRQATKGQKTVLGEFESERDDKAIASAGLSRRAG
jgi:hypothetical protein